MKKRSLFIVVAMVLLLAVVLGMGGTTFAKYITSKTTGTETATVAKWGYVVSADAEALFGEKYNNLGAISDSGAAVVSATAAADGDTNVVAPGTKGQMTFSVNGTAEVLSKITVDVTDTNVVQLTKNIGGTDIDVDNGTDGNQPYEPIVWEIEGAATVTDPEANVTDLLQGVTKTGLTKAELVAALEALDRDDIAANSTVAINLTIKWEWAFDVDPADDTVDAYDTALGALVHKAALAADANPDNNDKHEAGSAVGTTAIDLGVTITVEQIQD